MEENTSDTAFFKEVGLKKMYFIRYVKEKCKYLWRMDGVWLEKGGVLFEHKLSNVKIRCFGGGKDATAHDNTFKNLKDSPK